MTFREQVQQLRAQGLNFAEIGRAVGVPTNKAWYYATSPTPEIGYDTSFLDQDSEIRSYFLGLFVTDGWVSNRTVYISSTDSQIIEDLAAATGYTNTITKSSTGGYARSGVDHRLQYARAIHEHITNLGFTNQKTGHEFVPSGISSTTFHHFIRGVSDGDGSLERRKDGRLTWSLISACEPFLQSILDSLRERRVIAAHGVHIKARAGNSFRLRLTISDTIALCKFMYEGASLCLHRKRAVFEQSVAEAAPLHHSIWTVAELELARSGVCPTGRTRNAYSYQRWVNGWAKKYAGQPRSRASAGRIGLTHEGIPSDSK